MAKLKFVPKWGRGLYLEMSRNIRKAMARIGVAWRSGMVKRQRFAEQCSRWSSIATIRTIVLVVLIALVDFLAPLEMGAGVLYIAAVLSAVPIPYASAVLITAGVCSGLVVTEYLTSTSSARGSQWEALIGRGLALYVIWIAAGMSHAWNQVQRRRMKELSDGRLLQQIAALTAMQVSFRQALTNSLKALGEILNWPVAHVYWRDASGTVLEESGVWHGPAGGQYELLRLAAKGNRYERGQGVPGRIWETGIPLVVPDVSKSPSYTWMRDPERLGVHGAFAMPILVGSQVVAVIEFFSTEPMHVDPDFAPLARKLGVQLGRLFERRRSEELLRENEERLRLALQSGQMGSWEWTADSNRVIWSQETERIHGIEPGQFLRTSEALSQTIHSLDRNQAMEAFRTALTSGQDIKLEYRIVRPDGTTRWLEVSGAIHTGPEGQNRRMIGVCTDITHRKQVEAGLKRAKESAESINRLRNQFLANVSHELRTPMNSILGMLQLALEEKDLLSQELCDWLETAQHSADSLLVLLNDLLDFSKLESGKVRIESQPFALRKMVRETIKPLSLKAFAKGVELILEVAPDVPDALIGDAHRLQQVVINLVNNAIKFTDQGEIVMTIERQPDDDVFGFTLMGDEASVDGPHLPVINSANDRSTSWAALRFSVCDTGVGISSDDLERVFEPFAQGDESSTRRYGGVGLGLAITSELVRRMGGDLAVRSTLGEGSSFEFSIACQLQTTEPDATSTDEFEIAALRDVSVLVVDDNRSSRQQLGEWLKRWGLAPDLAIDAEHALGKLHRAEREGRRYGLLIVDGVMPGMDGLALLECIRSGFDSPAPAIMLVSPADARAFKKRGGSKHVAAYLEKPVIPPALYDSLLAALRIRSPEHRQRFRTTDRDRPTRPLSILLCEDSLANQKVVCQMLGRRGHKVTVAGNGREAVELYQSDTFDSVLMDVQMPILDGFQATAAIRQWEVERGTYTPIIAMTAHTMQDMPHRCLASGMDAYLGKPIDADRLNALVEKMAAIPGAGRQTQTNGSAELTKLDINADSPLADDSPAIDLADVMRRLDDDMQLFRDLIEVFEGESATLLDEIRKAVRARDEKKLEHSAHKLRGLAANLGARDVVQLADRLETMGREATFKGAQTALRYLRRETDRVLQELSLFREAPSLT